MSLSPRLTSSLRQRLAMTPSLRQSLKVLAMRIGAARRFAAELAADNPFLEAHLPNLPDLPSAGAGKSEIDFDHFHHDAVHPVPLSQHLLAQIGVAIPRPEDRALAYGLMEYLSPAGWLEEGAIARMANQGADKAQLRKVLAQLQQLEPVGVFARDLAECISLQLADHNLLSEDAIAVLGQLKHAAEGTAALALKTQLPEDRIIAVLRHVRECNPKPGALFLYDEGEMFRPDLMVEISGKAVTITVNDESLPSLSLRQDAAPLDDAGKILLEQARAEVAAMRRSLQHRSERLLAAGTILAEHQLAFLEQGEISIKPLTMTELADKMGVHKSTISRLVEGKLIQTPRGMMELSAFFSPSVAQPNGGEIASRAVIAHIRAMIVGEDSQDRLTDTVIANNLANHGIIVARRTVAKYRQQANIPSQHKR